MDVLSMDRTDAYRNKLRALVSSQLQKHPASFEHLCRRSRGAFPSVVREVMEEIVMETGIERPPNETADCTTIDLDLHEHPLDYAWSWSSSAVDCLVSHVRQGEEPVCCLGTPTLYQRLRGTGVDAYLIDRNEEIRRELSEFDGERTLIRDINEHPIIGDKKFGTVVMDPPWYLDHMHSWLKTALCNSSTGTVLLTTVFPELVRPSATRERKRLVSDLSEVGSVRYTNDVLLYETPLFERETLVALGLPAMSCWRPGEALRVDVMNPELPLDPPTPPEEDWRRVRVNEQIVAIRKNDGSGDEIAVSSPYPDGSYVLRSVSRRDVVRSRINFWTSANRVAILSGVDRVMSFLTGLSNGSDIEGLLTSFSASNKEIQVLRRIINLVDHK